MNIYEKTLQSLKCGTFLTHIKSLENIQSETTDEELIRKVVDLLVSLGSINDFSKTHDLGTNFSIQEDNSDSAKKLINYCQKHSSS